MYEDFCNTVNNKAFGESAKNAFGATARPRPNRDDRNFNRKLNFVLVNRTQLCPVPSRSPCLLTTDITTGFFKRSTWTHVFVRTSEIPTTRIAHKNAVNRYRRENLLRSSYTYYTSRRDRRIVLLYEKKKKNCSFYLFIKYIMRVCTLLDSFACNIRMANG